MKEVCTRAIELVEREQVRDISAAITKAVREKHPNADLVYRDSYGDRGVFFFFDRDTRTILYIHRETVLDWDGAHHVVSGGKYTLEDFMSTKDVKAFVKAEVLARAIEKGLTEGDMACGDINVYFKISDRYHIYHGDIDVLREYDAEEFRGKMSHEFNDDIVNAFMG